MNWTFEQGLTGESDEEKKSGASSVPSGWVSAFLGSAQEAFVEDGAKRAVDLGKKAGANIIGTVIDAMDGVQQMAEKKKAEEAVAALEAEEQKRVKDARTLAKRQRVWNLVGQLVTAYAQEAWDKQTEKLHKKK